MCLSSMKRDEKRRGFERVDNRWRDAWARVGSLPFENWRNTVRDAMSPHLHGYHHLYPSLS